MIDKSIIFLDIDGVLNVMMQQIDEFGSLFHPHLVENLKRIIEKTNADIVISSSWRMNGVNEMQRMWEMRDLPGKLIDVTPILNTTRGHEIAEWLRLNIYSNYCIIDDDSDMLPEQMNRFVKTSGNEDHEDCVDLGYGLTSKCADKVIHILTP